MANRFVTPRPQYFINPVTGAPLSGGKLFFYASGTATPLATYTTPSLSVATTNPVILNSAGMPPTDIFLQNLSYTVVLTDSNGVTLWSADNVYASDFSTVAMFTSYNGNPNGFVAGTAGSSTQAASVIWDYQNQVLYVCTATGNAATATWTAITSNTTAASVAVFQGYLTPTSGTPIITASTTATSIFYTPFIGTTVSLYNGTALTNSTFAELTLNLAAASHLANTLYDVFVFNNSGVLTLVTGPAWTNSSAGTGNRGTGAGTTQISRGASSGIWTNTVSMTGTNGTTTYAGIAAGQATYLGTIQIDAAAGNVTCHIAYGQSRKWGIWNAYNRQPINIRAGDGTASWNYNTNTIRAANGSSANSITTLCGLPEERLVATYFCKVKPTNGLGTAGGVVEGGESTVGIGVNSTTAYTGTQGSQQATWTINGGNSVYPNTYSNQFAQAIVQPAIGIQTISALERTPSQGVDNMTYFGTEANMLLNVQYRG